MRLQRELITLLGLFTDRQQTHLRVRELEDLLREDGAHVRELEQVLWARIRIRAAVEQDAGAALRRDRHGDGGAHDTRQPA